VNLNQLTRSCHSQYTLPSKGQEALKNNLICWKDDATPILNPYYLQNRKALKSRIDMYMFQIRLLENQGISPESLNYFHSKISLLSRSLQALTIVTDPFTGQKFSTLEMNLLGGGNSSSKSQSFIDQPRNHPAISISVEKHKEEVDHLRERIEFIEDKDSRIQVMQALQWLTRHQASAIFKQDPDQIEERLVTLIGALQIAIAKRENLLGSSIAELIHSSINCIFDKTEKYHYSINEEKKNNLIRDIKNLENQVETKINAYQLPTNALKYELDIIRKGIQILPDTGNGGEQAFLTTLKGSIKSVLTLSIDRDFLSGLGQIASYAVQEMYRDFEGKVFKEICYLNACQAHLLEHIIKAKGYLATSDEVKKIKAFLLEIQDKIIITKDRWELTYAWIKLLTNLIVQQDKGFSKQYIKSKLKNENDIENIWKLLISKEIFLPLSSDSIAILVAPEILVKCL